MKGIVQTNSKEPDNAIDCKEETLSILLGCNSLLNINGKPVGDPIEVAMFKEVKGKIDRNETTCERKTRIIPIRKYQFESSLKRMTVLARVYSGIYQKTHYTRVLCKGAPETIKTLLKQIPENYDECYRRWAKEGYRILALAYGDNEKFEYNTKREDLEKDLTFCGFAIVETPLKKNAGKYISELIKAKYGVCIITGDHLLTTSKVSKDLKLGPDQFALLKVEDKKMKWNDLDNNFIQETKSVDEIKQLATKYTLGMTGDEYKLIDEVTDMPNRHEMIQYITLFCRVSPTQKDDIIKDLIKSGKNPSMCGDGSNDVGALKRATIGVAVLNIEETESQKKEPFNFLSFDDDTTIKNGDVTAAAPFTSKSGNIKCIKNIFIQGRCTLVTNFQMYKILALNCLMTAYSESVLALKGIKFSDYQSTIIGFAVSIFFLMLSRAVPLKEVNSNHPPMTIFTWAAIISIIGQAIVDLGAMILILYITERIDPLSIGQEKSLAAKSSPTLINSIMIFFQMLNQPIT
jgi:cation-transporting ATPase 13A1